MRIFHLGLCVGPPPFDSMRKAFLANCTDYIELSTGEKLRCADEHLVYKVDGSYCETQNLEIGDKVVTKNGFGQIKKLKKLSGRWVTILKTFPMVVLSEKEVFKLHDY